MSNFEKAVEIMGELATEYGRPGGDELFGLDEDAALALKENGLLAPDVQVIRTVEDLEALDPDTLVGTHREIVSSTFGAGYILAAAYLGDLTFPMVVVASGAQVREAREAMEEEHG